MKILKNVPEKVIHCPQINTMDCENMKIVGGNRTIYNVGSRVLFKCDKGFKSAGEESILCNESGSWSGPIPYCAGMLQLYLR